MYSSHGGSWCHRVSIDTYSVARGPHRHCRQRADAVEDRAGKKEMEPRPRAQRYSTQQQRFPPRWRRAGIRRSELRGRLRGVGCLLRGRLLRCEIRFRLLADDVEEIAHAEIDVDEMQT